MCLDNENLSKKTACGFAADAPGGGRGIAVEMSGVYFFSGLCVIQAKRQCNENITDCRGKLPWFYQQTVPVHPQCEGYSRGLKNEKSTFQLFPGGGSVVTND